MPIPDNTAEIYKSELEIFRTVILAESEPVLRALYEAANRASGIQVEAFPAGDDKQKERAAQAFGQVALGINKSRKNSDMDPEKNIVRARKTIAEGGTILMLTADATSGEVANTNEFRKLFDEEMAKLSKPEKLPPPPKSSEEDIEQKTTVFSPKDVAAIRVGLRAEAEPTDTPV